MKKSQKKELPLPVWRSFVVIGLAVGALGLTLARYPLDLRVLFSLSQLGFPAWAKLGEFLRTLGVLALLNLAAWQFGTWIDAVLGPHGSNTESVAPIVRLAFGFVAISTLTLGLASCRLLFPVSFLLILGIPSAIAAARIVRLARGWVKAVARKSALRRPDWLWLVFGAILVPRLLGAFIPFWGWDALTDHLAIPQRFLAANRVVLSPFSLLDAFPLGTEMLYLCCLALNGPVVAVLLHAEFGALAIVAVFRLGSLRSRIAGIGAAVVLLADPLMHFEMSIAYNDLEVTLLVLLAVASFADWAGTERDQLPLRPALLAASCATIRYPGAIVPVILAVLAVARRRPLRTHLIALSTFGLAAVLVMLPWFARNLVMSGNPFAPALQGLFYAPGKEFFSTVAVRQQFAFTQKIGMGRDLGALILLPFKLTFASIEGQRANSFGSQVGCFYLVGLAVALLSPAMRRDGLSRICLWTALLVTPVWFYGSQEARYLLPVLPLIALASGIGVADLFRAAPGTGAAIRKVAYGALAAIAVAGVAYAAWPGWNKSGFWYACALGGQDPASAPQDPIFPAGRRLREQLPANTRLLPVFESRSFALRGIDQIPWVPLEAPPALQLIHRAPTAHALRCELARLGVTHVLLNFANLKRYGVQFVEGYTAGDFRLDAAKLQDLLRTYARPLGLAGLPSGMVVGELLPAPEDCSSGTGEAAGKN